jgi:hypothetical protein
MPPRGEGMPPRGERDAIEGERAAIKGCQNGARHAITVNAIDG